MLRLAVHGANDSRLQEIACRLRGVRLDVGQSPSGDAAVFFAPPLDAIEPYLHANKPVLVALDNGLTTERLQTLSDLVRNASASLLVANPDRYLPSRQVIRLQLDKLGAPGLIRIHRWEPSEPSPVRGRLDPRDLDSVIWYFGTTPNVVHAVAHARGTQVHLGFPNGGMALIDQAMVPPGDSYYSLSVICASGAVYADDHPNMQLIYQGGSPSAVRALEGVPWAALVQDFLDSINAGSVQHPHWQTAILIAEAVEASLRTKQAVSLGES